MRILIGIASAGTIGARTAHCWVTLATTRADIVTGKGVVILRSAPPAIGSYISENVSALAGLFLRGEYDLFLRIDADMVWTREWAKHFLGAAQELLTRQERAGADRPWIHGAVYPRRQPYERYVPMVQPLAGTREASRRPAADPRASSQAGGLAYRRSLLIAGDSRTGPRDEGPPGAVRWQGGADSDYFEWIAAGYSQGATAAVRRVGGGWTLYSRAAAAIPGIFTSSPEATEDYHACDAVTRAGGQVYATFPHHLKAELMHQDGSRFVRLAHYLALAMQGLGVSPHLIFTSCGASASWTDAITNIPLVPLRGASCLPEISLHLRAGEPL